jgi:two-component system chemotaxis response regulator CheB
VNKTRVLICDDSALMRAMLTEIINSAPDLTVVGAARDPLQARDMIKELAPDVLTLDVEMPRMDGIEFLDRLMRLRPMPVVMISTLTQRGSEVTLQALEIGAVDFVAKPRVVAGQGLDACAQEICDKVRAAAQARPRHAVRATSVGVGPLTTRKAAPAGVLGAGRYVAIGASTGGTEAIREVLGGMPPESPPILIVQHMPEMFTGSFARRLDSLCAVRVKEAEDGERLQPGCAYLAPGHSHLRVRRAAGGYVCALSQEDPVNRHRPSVDVLFHSVAKEFGRNALGVLLTGMGKDGAQGLLAMRQAGAWTIAQDQESSVVYGMPREAAAIGGCVEVASLKDIAHRVVQRLAAPAAQRAAG